MRQVESYDMMDKRAVKDMKQYEYKFARFKVPPDLNWDRKLNRLEEEWNELGREGWQFCMQGDGVLIFMREIRE